MKKIILLTIMCAACTLRLFAQGENGTTHMLLAGHTEVTAVMDSGQNNIGEANFSAIFLYQLSDKLFVESELEVGTGEGSVEIGLEHANLIWMMGKNIAFHAGRFVPHFGMFRGRLAEGFISRFASNPVGFGDGGIGPMEAVGFGFQGGFALGDSKMNYDLWVSDGPQLLTDEENAGQFEYEAYTDNNKNKAVGGRLGFLPFSNSSLELGFSYESAMKTGTQYSEFEDIAVNAIAVDLNFYHQIKPLKSTLRLTGEYKSQMVDNVDYTFPVPDDTTGAVTVMHFDNSANTYYGMLSIRPTGSENKVLRNLEIAFRYSSYTTPDGAPWAYYNTEGKNVALNQTAVSLCYWLKWNCVAKLCWQKQDGVTDQTFVQLYYGF